MKLKNEMGSLHKMLLLQNYKFIGLLNNALVIPLLDRAF